MFWILLNKKLAFIQSTITTNVDSVFATDVVADCVFLYHSVSFRELSKRNHFQKMIKKEESIMGRNIQKDGGRKNETEN